MINQFENNEKRSPFKEFAFHPTEADLMYDNELFIPLDVPGIINNRYFISNYGRFFDGGLNRIIPTRSDCHPVYVGDELVSYQTIRLNTTTNFRKDFRVHRLVLSAFDDSSKLYDSRYMPNHKDFRRNNNYFNPYDPNSNLEWVTASENSKWNFAAGRQTQAGEANSCCKITEKDVLEIAELLMQGYGDIEVANMMNNPNIVPYIVANIRNKRSWAYLTKDYDFPKMKKAKMFTDEEVHKFCQYFQDTKEQNKGKMKMDIVKEAIHNLGYELNDSLFNAVKLIRRRVMYKDIVSQYDY